MNNRFPIFLRAHTELPKRLEKLNAGRVSNGATLNEPKWPEHVLVIDTETSIDERQSLTIGVFQFCRLLKNGYKPIAEGIIYGDHLPQRDPDGFSDLREYVATANAGVLKQSPNHIDLLSRAEFVSSVFFPSMEAGAAVVGFNLPFDLTRLAADCRKARRRNESWSLVFLMWTHPETRLFKPNPLSHRIVITHKDSKVAFIRLVSSGIRSKETGERLKKFIRGRFIDLRTLGWALRNKSYSLDGACRDFKVVGKLDHEPTGRISHEEIAYCRGDVGATLRLLNAMRTEFDCHEIDLYPEKAFSPASIAKGYIKKMGIIPPFLKFNLPAWVHGAAMQAYYGGRAECRIRQTEVPVVLTDFTSEYPTANIRLGLWRMLIADELRIEGATDDVKQLLETVTLESAFDPTLWKSLSFFALVEPDETVLPVRADYNGKTSNIGVNPLTSAKPIYYSGPDLVAAKLQTGRVPKVIRAFRIVPIGQQSGLEKVSLRRAIEIDPKSDDFFKRVIEARAQTKANKTLASEEREALAYFLKILANSGSYGLFVEVNPERVGEREFVRVFSGDTGFQTSSLVVEPQGTWYFPIFAALITAAGRLLLTLLECSVHQAGGTYLFCDTDSLAIVASQSGGLIPCEGGPYRLPDGRAAIKALTWEKVREIVSKFKHLNPYGGRGIPKSILKIEDVNFAEEGSQQQIYGWAIAAKRYALYSRAPDGDIQVRKASAHGLGFLYLPRPKGAPISDTPDWVIESWEWILRGVLGLPRTDPSWFEHPAMMRVAVTTPEVLKAMQSREIALPYCDRTKPCNFMLMPLLDRLGGFPQDVDRNRFTLVGIFTPDPSRWHSNPYTNIHDGRSYRLAPPGRQRTYEARAKTLGNYICEYTRHPEAKSLAPDGQPCKPDTHGLLMRTPVIAAGFRYIGKETDRRWEQGEDISIVESETTEYSPEETDRLVADPVLIEDSSQVSIRALAKQAGVSESTVKAARRGERLRRATVEKLKNGLIQLVTGR